MQVLGVTRILCKWPCGSSCFILAPRGRGKKCIGSINWLIDAGIVNVCYNVRVFNLPLAAYREEDHFKLYMGDTGLVISILDPEPIYKSSMETSAFAKERSSRTSFPECFGRARIRLISLIATIRLRLISSFPRTGSWFPSKHCQIANPSLWAHCSKNIRKPKTWNW